MNQFNHLIKLFNLSKNYYDFRGQMGHCWQSFKKLFEKLMQCICLSH